MLALALVPFVAVTGSTARASSVATPPPPRVGISRSIVPEGPTSFTYLTGIDGRVTTNPEGATPHTLPVGRIVDNYGTGVDIVEQRLLVIAPAGTDLAAVLARTGGAVVDERTVTVPVGAGAGAGAGGAGAGAGGGSAGDSTLWTLIVPIRGVTTRYLREDLRSLDSRSRGWLRMSDSGTKRTLAIAAHEAAAYGTPVSLDFRATGASVPDGTTSEAGGADAFTWNGYTRRVADPVPTGVADAWRALALAGRGGPVDVVVSDGGFLPGPEVPMTVDPPSAVNANPAACSGNTPCPWHGTGSAATIGGLVDNGKGAAGTGGPVARMHAELFGGSAIGALYLAIGHAVSTGARLVNASWGTSIPASLAWSLEPITGFVATWYSKGITVVASAGNSSIDVDAEDCVWVCWEQATWFPCETSGVICVGALDPATGKRASYTNFGSNQRRSADGAPTDDRSVDVYAPGTTQITGLPAAAGLPAATNDAATQSFSGTSAAAPFVTGVLALVQATDSTLQGHSLLARMTEAASVWSTAAPNDGLLIDAYRAVTDGLRPLAPAVTIVNPGPGATTGTGVDYRLTARVDDIVDGFHCCAAAVRWYVDGAYAGTGTNVSVAYGSMGLHLIEAKYTNSDGVEGSDARYLRVDDGPPVVTLVHPHHNANHYPTGVPVLVQADVDYMQNWNRGPITCSWSSDVDGPLSFGADHGCRGTYTFPTDGWRLLTVRATDGNGITSTDSGYVCFTSGSFECTYRTRELFGHSSVTAPAEFAKFTVGDVIDLDAWADLGPVGDTFEWRWTADTAISSVTVQPSGYSIWGPWMGQGAGRWDTSALSSPNLGTGSLCYVDTARTYGDQYMATDCVRIAIQPAFH